MSKLRFLSLGYDNNYIFLLIYSSKIMIFVLHFIAIFVSELLQTFKYKGPKELKVINYRDQNNNKL